MRVRIKPSEARGTVAAPPSKSMTHRLLICAGLCGGESIIRGIIPSDDVLATLDCLSAIGAQYTCGDGTVKIKGVTPEKIKSGALLPCRECGSTLRFFIPICLLGTGGTLTGSERLLERPLGVYESVLGAQGISLSHDGGGITVSGTLRPGTFDIPGDVSSQFISGLLFALPLLDGDSVINITGAAESMSYVELTLGALGSFGVHLRRDGARRLLISGGQRYAPQDVTVEGDYSGTAFFEALNHIGGDVVITGLSENSRQGDRVYTDYFKKLSEGTPELSLADCPDLGPILFALAAAKNGAQFTETRRLRFKESDRAQAMADELAKLGAEVTVGEDTVTVKPARLKRPAQPLCGHGDHRIVMSLAVLLTLVGGEIDGAESVAKSMPDFFEKLGALGVDVTYEA